MFETLMLIGALMLGDGIPDRSFGAAKPAISDLGIATDSAGLSAVRAETEAAMDAECFPSGYLVVSCFRSMRAEVYQMTDEGHPAHPAIYFRGYRPTSDASGTQLEERGWFGGDKPAAMAFFSRSQDSMVQPIAPKQTN